MAPAHQHSRLGGVSTDDHHRGGVLGADSPRARDAGRAFGLVDYGGIVRHEIVTTRPSSACVMGIWQARRELSCVVAMQTGLSHLRQPDTFLDSEVNGYAPRLCARYHAESEQEGDDGCDNNVFAVHIAFNLKVCTFLIFRSTEIES